jgi:hypothetical protein
LRRIHEIGFPRIEIGINATTISSGKNSQPRTIGLDLSEINEHEIEGFLRVNLDGDFCHRLFCSALQANQGRYAQQWSNF